MGAGLDVAQVFPAANLDLVRGTHEIHDVHEEQVEDLRERVHWARC